MDNALFSRHIALADVKITDAFWQKRQHLIETTVLPYQYEALHDRVDGADKSYAVENFRKAAAVVKQLKNGATVPVYPADKWVYDEQNSAPEAFKGWVFQDSDVYKWLEAAAYTLTNHFDAALKAKADALIDLICAAQLPSGYLDTLYIINNRDGIFTNLRDFHELYCFGHLAEAAVAYHRATGETALLDAACRFADLIADTFGENKKKGYPGHEIAELALVKLYEETGKRAYLDTAAFFLDERGKRPYYFDTERNETSDGERYHYHQAHKPPREQEEAVGHAVRAVYLYSGMADVAKATGDDGLYAACQRLMRSILDKKLYITGGIGATADGEAFSFDYDLPNDLAYCETCASVGLLFFARRMLEIAPDAAIADAAERALYNTVLAGMAEDGRHFFYVNPLEVLPEASEKDSRKRHVKPVRQKWFGCACCPPNLARLLASLGEYGITANENTVYVHQYFGSEVHTEPADLRITSAYTENGTVHLAVRPQREMTLALRIPTWCGENYRFSAPCTVKEGYAYFTLSTPCDIQAAFALVPRLVNCSNRVRENIGKVAVMRGPLVYCLEEADNGKDLHLLRVSKEPQFAVNGDIITADGFREAPDGTLYADYAKRAKTPVRLTFIPYYRWGNRGENEMTVYVRI